MRHAEVLTDRILFLEGLPNYQKLFPLRIGETVKEQFESRHGDRGRGRRPAARGIEYMRSVGDVTSARLFEDILADEEHHVDYLETQLGLIEKLGEQLYVAQLVEQPSAD